MNKNYWLDLNEDVTRKKLKGIMSLGGMCPARIEVDLPARFMATSLMELQSGELLLFCSHAKNKPFGEVESYNVYWIDEDTIVFQGNTRKLVKTPTYRTNHCCFALVPEPC